MIRNLTENDLPAMAELFAAVFSREPWNEEWSYESAHERLSIFQTSQNAISLGYFENEKLRGFLMGIHQPYQKERYFFLEEMCVSYESQGIGIGKALWVQLEQELKNLNVSTINLLTLRGTPAEQFYSKRGCEITERVPLMYKQF